MFDLGNDPQADFYAKKVETQRQAAERNRNEMENFSIG